MKASEHPSIIGVSYYVDISDRFMSEIDCINLSDFELADKLNCLRNKIEKDQNNYSTGDAIALKTLMKSIKV